MCLKQTLEAAMFITHYNMKVLSEISIIYYVPAIEKTTISGSHFYDPSYRTEVP